jgi:hypothetical protein
MEALQVLGIALGLATLAGINLYLTVFVTGLAINRGWIDITQTFPELAVLGDPLIVGIAGVLYALEFFADKVPWVDSLWDAVHTFIRPIGGAFLALHVLGQTSPAIEVVAALLAGGVTLMAHSTKAGTRLLANHSPEPFTNVALSVAGDAAVIGGLALMKHDPLLALAVFSAVLLVIAYVGPKLFRIVRANVWLVGCRIAALGGQRDARLSNELPVELETFFEAARPEAGSVAWAAPCLCLSVPGCAGNKRGYLVGTHGADTVWFVAQRLFRKVAVPLDLARCKVGIERRFLGEQITLCANGVAKPVSRLMFDATRRGLAANVAAALRERLPAPAAPARELAAA